MGISLFPCFFNYAVDPLCLENMTNNVFPQFWSVLVMDQVLGMCLASLMHHHAEVTAFAPDHIAWQNVSMFCNPVEGIITVNVVHSWETRGIQLTGVPPHVKELGDLDALQRESLQVADKV